MSTPTRTKNSGGAPDRGSAPIEVVLLAPVLVLLIMLAVIGGTAASVRIEAEAAAAAAARAASLQRDEATAAAEAERVALAGLSDRCLNAGVDVNADFSPGGRVTVTVTCTVDTTGLPSFGTKTITSIAHSPVDAWRGWTEP
jgi:Flp pilus assembly protein TadG